MNKFSLRLLQTKHLRCLNWKEISILINSTVRQIYCIVQIFLSLFYQAVLKDAFVVKPFEMAFFSFRKYP